jgi:D-alanyl-D-alanine carboxypeptidase
MKKICLFFILFLIPISVFGQEVDLAENAGSAIMIEASTGEILYKKNLGDTSFRSVSQAVFKII